VQRGDAVGAGAAGRAGAARGDAGATLRALADAVAPAGGGRARQRRLARRAGGQLRADRSGPAQWQPVRIRAVGGAVPARGEATGAPVWRVACNPRSEGCAGGGGGGVQGGSWERGASPVGARLTGAHGSGPGAWASCARRAATRMLPGAHVSAWLPWRSWLRRGGGIRPGYGRIAWRRRGPGRRSRPGRWDSAAAWGRRRRRRC